MRLISMGVLLLLCACGKPQATSIAPAPVPAAPDFEPQRAHLRSIREAGQTDIGELRNANYDPMDFSEPPQVSRFDKRRAEFQRYLERLSPEENQALYPELSELIFDLRTQGLEVHGYALLRQLEELQAGVSRMQTLSTSHRRPDDEFEKIFGIEDEAKWAARLSDELWKQIPKSISLGEQIKNAVKRNHLEKVLYVGPILQSFPQTSYDLGGPRDIESVRLVEKTWKEPSLMVLHRVKVSLENLDSAFVMGSFPFLSAADRDSFLGLLKALQARMTKVRKDLQLTKSIETVNTLRDVFHQ